MQNKSAIYLFCTFTCVFALNWGHIVNGPTFPQNYLFQSIELPNDEIVSIGYTSSDYGEIYLWILRCDSLGSIISNKEWRNAPKALPVSADTNALGDIGITGISEMFSTSSAFFALYEPDIDTLNIWVFAPPDTALEAYGIVPTPDSGFVISCWGFSGGSNFLRIMKLAPPDWEIEWQSDFDVPDRIFLWNICCDDDGTSNVVGYFYPLNYGYFLRVNSDGDSVLTEEFPLGYKPSCIETAYNTGYIIIGKCSMGSWLAKIDTLGTVIWDKNFEVTNFSFMNITKILPDKYAIVGVKTLAGGDQDLAILVIDSLGDSLDCIIYGAPDTVERGRGIWQCANGDIVACGMIDLGVHWNGLIIRRELFDTFSIDEIPTKPVTSSLNLRPNPFNSAVTIEAPLASRLEIFDISGRPVRDLSGLLSAERNSAVLWDGKSDSGANLPSGVYFARARCEDKKLVTKIALIR